MIETAEKKEISIPEQIVIKELAEKMNLPVTDLIAELMKNGIMSSMNERIDFDTAGIIAEDLGFEVKKVEEEENGQKEDLRILEAALEEDEEAEERPPVVVVMGHVDHGKTKLLDAIRETNIVDDEAGGITQSIGAYQIEDKGKLITLIDTPGHEAFSAMRGRGARVADIAILVVAADDGVKPQTIEAHKIIKDAKLPFVVAINKIDKSEANIEKVKKELTELGIVPEEWGGRTVFAEISAKEKRGISGLLDMVLLVAEMEKKNIVANPKREAVGTIIESHIDKGAGPQATVLIQTGTLKEGDNIIVGNIYGKVKALKDWRGDIVSIAKPSKPVQILGLKGAPKVGDILHTTKNQAEIKSLIKKQKEISYHKEVDQRITQKSSNGENDDDNEKENVVQELNVILKTDTLGSQEAIIESLNKLKHPEVRVVITSKGLGNITEKDIIQTDSADAFLIGFNVILTSQAQEIQRDRQANLNLYTIIYELIDFVKNELEKMLAPEYIQTDLGKVEILAIFKTEKEGQIVGGKVKQGKIENNTKVSIMRNNEKIGSGHIVQLQSEKKNAKEVSKDSECGMKIETHAVIQEGDIIEVYSEEKKARKIEFK
ncbi:translation initiation factor IF-2 [Patescibacteria group bacterium]|nr:translation initiation factor IF-2 [Patescibacteria group bacterium]MBU1075314.1 translation initiation factor IF-2 [Patescibacteria group bacterium]MBU1951546.1 translation initiation factor IF-2 [Patescibacteria group bacterium]